MPPTESSGMTLKRIYREIADVRKEDLGDIVLKPSSEDDLFLWKGVIPGPEGSCYEGGKFHVDLKLAPDYPFSAPTVIFKTRIYHMNISERGNVCIDILKQNWSPALSLFKVMLSLSSLLTDPNPKDPLVPSIATEFVRNRQSHDRTARQWTQLYALPKPPPPVASPVTAKQKGKRRDTLCPPSLSTAASTSFADPAITINDSDDERRDHGIRRTGRSARHKRPRDETGDEHGTITSRHIPRRQNVSVVLDLDHSEETSAGRGAGGASHPRKRARGVPDSSNSSRQSEEIIVIDD